MDVFRYLLNNPKAYELHRNTIKDIGIQFEQPQLRLFWEWWDYHYERQRRSPNWGWFEFAIRNYARFNDATKDKYLDCLNTLRSTGSEINRDEVFQFFLQKYTISHQLSLTQMDWSNGDELLEENKKRLEFLDTIRNPDKIQDVGEGWIFPFSEESIESSWDNLQEIS